MTGIAFIKMHGLGNDFVIVDGRAAAFGLDPDWVRAVADRRTGVGCDQLIAILPSEVADARMVIRNADGRRAEACGNASRCVAALLMNERGSDRARIETDAGIIEARAAADGDITIDMGAPRRDWRDVPLAEEADTLHLDLGAAAPGPAVALSTGVPHAVIFVDDVAAIDVAGLGAVLERHPIFPAAANIDFAQVLAPDSIRMRVWERGAGVTRACGTGACAVAVAAARRGLCGRAVRVLLDGGALDILWRDDDHVEMTGPVATAFEGRFSPALTPPPSPELPSGGAP